MSFGKSLGGLIRVKLISADPDGALQRIRRSGITAYNIERLDALTWRFSVNSTNVNIIQKLADQFGCEIECTESPGFFRTVIFLRKRFVFLLGMLMLVVLSFWVPSRVLFVEVQGNTQVSTREIIEQAQTCGIYFGASRKTVRSQQVKNKLMSEMPQLQWAGVSTSGCVAILTVHERNVKEPAREKEGVCSIVAARDGIITEMTVLRGNGLCKPGMAVKAGQVLISGYQDCGICIRAAHAEGEILAYTQHCLTAVCPINRVIRSETLGTKEKYSLIIGKKEINFMKYSGISGSSCVKIYEQKYMTLPGGFVLPIVFARESTIYYETFVGAETEAEKFLRYYAENYVTQLTLAGKIENAHVVISDGEDLLRLQGVYGCLENIGVVRMEESLPSYGKSD